MVSGGGAVGAGGGTMGPQLVRISREQINSRMMLPNLFIFYLYAFPNIP